MAWVNDLASGLGIPAGAATLAMAMYAACAAAEKAARPEALKDIGRILKDPSWSRSVRPAAIIEKIFVWTFGERHLSWRCIQRSVVASIAFVAALLSVMLVGWHIDLSGFARDFEQNPAFFALIVVSCGITPDYASLWKARLLLRIAADRARWRSPILFIVADLIASVLIACLAVIPYGEFYLRYIKGHIPPVIVHSAELPYLKNNIASHTMIVLVACQFSTLLTSIWMILVLGSTAVVKVLAPLHRFTAWFLDVEKHPVQAIGIVAGVLVTVGSLIWTVLRAVI